MGACLSRFCEPLTGRSHDSLTTCVTDAALNPTPDTPPASPQSTSQQGLLQNGKPSETGTTTTATRARRAISARGRASAPWRARAARRRLASRRSRRPNRPPRPMLVPLGARGGARGTTKATHTRRTRGVHSARRPHTSRMTPWTASRARAAGPRNRSAAAWPLAWPKSPRGCECSEPSAAPSTPREDHST